MSNLSVFDFRFFNSFAQNFFCLTKVLILWEGTDINAVSDEEKNADNKNNKTKIVIDKGSIYINKKMIKTPCIIEIYSLFSRLKKMLPFSCDWSSFSYYQTKRLSLLFCCNWKWKKSDQYSSYVRLHFVLFDVKNNQLSNEIEKRPMNKEHLPIILVVEKDFMKLTKKPTLSPIQKPKNPSISFIKETNQKIGLLIPLVGISSKWLITLGTRFLT